MKAQVFMVMAVLGAMGASLAPEQYGQREMDLLASTENQEPMAAAVSRPFPFSDRHTVKHDPRGAEETNSCSPETQNPVSEAPPAVTSIASEETAAKTENPAATDCITSVAPASSSPSASTPTNPPQPDEVGGSSQSSPVAPCPETSQASSPPMVPEAPKPEPAPTEDFSFPGGGQMAPTAPCDQVVSTPAASAAANQTLVTVVVQPIEQVPSTSLPLHHSETQPLPKATETGPVQASAGSRRWNIEATTTVFALGVLGGWLAV